MTMRQSSPLSAKRKRHPELGNRRSATNYESMGGQHSLKVWKEGTGQDFGIGCHSLDYLEPSIDLVMGNILSKRGKTARNPGA